MNPEHPGNNTNLAVDMPSNVGTDSNMYWPEYLQDAWTYLEKKLLFIMRDNIFTRNLPAQFGMDYILMCEGEITHFNSRDTPPISARWRRNFMRKHLVSLGNGRYQTKLPPLHWLGHNIPNDRISLYMSEENS